MVAAQKLVRTAAALETIVSIVPAVSRVHMLGNPTLRTRAEEMVVMIGKLLENLPIVG